jgi:hypothetical protein
MATNPPAAEPASIERPRTTTRDPEDLRRRLEAWLATKLPAAAEPRIAEVRTPSSNGMSSETLLFDATWREGGGARSESLVARLAPEPSAVPVFPESSFGDARSTRAPPRAGSLPWVAFRSRDRLGRRVKIGPGREGGAGRLPL